MSSGFAHRAARHLQSLASSASTLAVGFLGRNSGDGSGGGSGGGAGFSITGNISALRGGQFMSGVYQPQAGAHISERISATLGNIYRITKEQSSNIKQLTERQSQYAPFSASVARAQGQLNIQRLQEQVLFANSSGAATLINSQAILEKQTQGFRLLAANLINAAGTGGNSIGAMLAGALGGSWLEKTNAWFEEADKNVQKYLDKRFGDGGSSAGQIGAKSPMYQFIQSMTALDAPKAKRPGGK